MKIKQLSFLSVLAIAVGLYSCDKEDNNTIASDNKSKVEMDEYTQASIQNFIDQVNGVTTRTEPTDPPTEVHKLRKYVEVMSFSACIEADGNCLPEVVVTPTPRPTPDSPGALSIGPIRYKAWSETAQGMQLKKMVDNKLVDLKINFNQETNIEYYIYNGVKDKNLEIVVPVTTK